MFWTGPVQFIVTMIPIPSLLPLLWFRSHLTLPLFRKVENFPPDTHNTPPHILFKWEISRNSLRVLRITYYLFYSFCTLSIWNSPHFREVRKGTRSCLCCLVIQWVHLMLFTLISVLPMGSLGGWVSVLTAAQCSWAVSASSSLLLSPFLQRLLSLGTDDITACVLDQFC